ncbi:MAG TPA: hypothetical protein VLA72_03945 [Anaerolineales bacterium]|nr:hypothetical protein [Anaerolineales bacterium]
MKRKRNLDREGLEVNLLNLLLVYRPIIQLCGLIIFVHGVVMIPNSISVGSITFAVAVFLYLVTRFSKLTFHLAKFGAWIGTLGKSK